MTKKVLALVMGVAISFASGLYAGSLASNAATNGSHACCQQTQAAHDEACCEHAGECSGDHCTICGKTENKDGKQGCTDGRCVRNHKSQITSHKSQITNHK